MRMTGQNLNLVMLTSRNSISTSFTAKPMARINIGASVFMVTTPIRCMGQGVQPASIFTENHMLTAMPRKNMRIT